MKQSISKSAKNLPTHFKPPPVLNLKTVFLVTLIVLNEFHLWWETMVTAVLTIDSSTGETLLSAVGSGGSSGGAEGRSAS